MARLAVIEFNPRKPLFVRRPFTANGHRYEPGQEFPWNRMALSVRKVRNMFEAGLLRHTVVVQPMAVNVTVEDKVVEDATPEAMDVTVEDNTDDLDTIDDMKELRAIAVEIGAPYKVSKVDQRQAIREKRKEMEQ